METNARTEALGAVAFVAAVIVVYHFTHSYIPDWVIWAFRVWFAAWVLYQLFRVGHKLDRWLDK